jgi:hypothetical protein
MRLLQSYCYTVGQLARQKCFAYDVVPMRVSPCSHVRTLVNPEQCQQSHTPEPGWYVLKHCRQHGRCNKVELGVVTAVAATHDIIQQQQQPVAAAARSSFIFAASRALS